MGAPHTGALVSVSAVDPALAELAAVHGVAVAYWDQAGAHHDVAAETVVAVLGAWGTFLKWVLAWQVATGRRPAT